MRHFVCVLLLFIIATMFVEGGWKEGRKGMKGMELSDKMKSKLKERYDAAKKKFKEMPKQATQRDKMVGNNTMRTDKKGGILMIQRKGQFLTMKIKEIIQRHANGTEKAKYPLRDITFEFKRDGNDNETYGVRAGVVEMKGMLPNSGNISVKIFIFAEAANITGEDGNTYELVEGGAKVNILIDWPEDAAHLDVELGIKCGFKGEFGRKAKKLNFIRAKKGKKFPSITRQPSTFAVCSHAQMTFSPSFQSDSNEVEMPSEYPSSEPLSSDGESIMKMRFKGKKIFYDPTNEVGDDIGDDIADDSSGVYQTPNAFLTLVLMVFCFFKLMY